MIQAQLLRGSLATWMNKFEWEFWMTGTFLPDQSYRDTIKTKRAFERFIADLRKNFGKNSIEYFMAVERFRSGDFTHVHALLNGLQGLTYREIGETWRKRFGREQIEGYDPLKGANYYLTKYVTKEICDWGLLIDQKKTGKIIYN